MNFSQPCKCNGLNGACNYCGGSGYLPDERPKIISILIDEKEKERQQREEEVYKKGTQEKMYLSNSKPKKKKGVKKKTGNQNVGTFKQIDETYATYKVGPSNPNRLKLGDTRGLGRKKK